MTEKAQKKTDYRVLMLDALRKIDSLEANLKAAQKQSNEAIAIVGMGCRFPAAEAGLSAYLELLRAGTDAIKPIPEWRWRMDDFFDPEPGQIGKMYVRDGGFVDQLEQFDAGFFEISPREAITMDPQQRMWLEVCWEALEQANIVPADLFSTQTGVFVGASSFDFATLMAKKLPLDQVDAYLSTGASLNILAGRLSYCLGLTGPSMAVDTACSSSLVAVHNACQSLRLGESDIALAGGVNAIMAAETYVAFSRGRMLSVKARCQTFSENADGFIRSEGCGAIVLKRLSDAEAQGDHIWAIIRGSAINQDGASGGLTIPSGPSQQAVINAALKAAKVKPEQVSYIEAHGTGTPLGDPIEMRALAASYGSNREQKPVYVASVKTNLGHLEAAAGIAGLIKTALSLHQAEIFPHLHFSQASSHIDWQSWPVKIPVDGLPWPQSDSSRIAAVSAFGLSGTNAHIILEQAADKLEVKTEAVKNKMNLLLLSAKTYPALQQMAANYATQLFSQTQVNLADICYSANSCRSRFNHRLVIAADSVAEFKTQLEQFAEQGANPGTAYQELTKSTKPRVAMLFTGQGSQWAGMAAQMYGYYPVFSEQLDRCDQLLQQFSTINLQSLLLDNTARDEISETINAQPALFAFEYAWAKQWQAWGVEPVCLIGHSLGEYVAACIAGVFDLEQALRLLVSRASLMQQAPGQGGMAAVFASAEQVQNLLSGFSDLVIAVYNSTKNQVVSGEQSELLSFLQLCEQQKIDYSRLATSHGFHSSCMQPILAEYADCLANIQFNKASVPIISNLSANLDTQCYARADYWLQHLRQPVQFQQSIETLQQQGIDLLIEIGPKPVLTKLVQQNNEALQVMPTCSADNSVASINLALARLVASGLELDWQQLNQGQRINLPTYPWQRQSYLPDWFNHQPVHGVEQSSLFGKWLSNSALPENTKVFEVKLDTSSQAWLSQHQIYQMSVAPLTLFISIIYQAVHKRYGHLNFVIEDFAVEKALLVSSQQLTLQLVLTAITGGHSIHFYSKKRDSDHWQSHAQGVIKVVDKADQLKQPLLPLADKANEISGQQFYQVFSQHGLQYGSAFQGIDKLWQEANKAVAKLKSTAGIEQMSQPHPARLDLAMQMLAAVFDTGDDLCLPVRIGRIQCWGDKFVDSHWVSADLKQSEWVDLQLYDQDKQLQFAMTGVEIAKVTEARLKQLLEPVSDWCYELVWQPYSSMSKQLIGSWLFISEQTELAIAKQLEKLGHKVKVLNFEQLLIADLLDVDEIVDFSGLAISTETSNAMSACAQLLQLLHLLKGQQVRLSLVTQQSQAEFCEQVNYSGAALWGMMAVLVQEHAELKPRIIELSAQEQLLAALLDNSDEQRLMATEQGLQVQRLQYDKTNTDVQITIDSQASYLITGAFGALGLITARWLIAKGARHLYLTSRQQPVIPSELQALQKQYPDLELIICQTDITQAVAVKQLFNQIEQSDRALKGLIHCAGFTDDDLLLNQSASRLNQLNQVKLQAAALLDKASRQQPLDFFILYSSANAVLGTIGQGAYAAANAAMDALAWQRKHEGYPALSINWGPWQTGIQQQSNDAMRTLWQQSGLGLIDEERALLVLEQLIHRANGQVTVFNIDWQKVAQNISQDDSPSLLKQLLAEYSNLETAAESEVEWMQQLSDAEPEQLKQLVSDWLKQQLAQLLKLSIEHVLLDKPLSSLGLDSLAAVEFRALMRKTMQLEVPVNQLLQSDGWGLVDYLTEHLSQAEQLEIELDDEEMLEGEI